MISALYRFYRYRLFPRIKHIRGTNFVLERLKNFTLREYEDIDSSEVINLKEEEWDNLIILDGCRYDLYKELTGEEGSAISPGSSSSHFTSKVFGEGDWSDTVMVTANPHIDDSVFEDLTDRKSEDVFHAVFRTYNEYWNEEHRTVMPEDVLNHAKTANKLFPDKRKIIWFMQPHHPFVNTELELNENAKGIKNVEGSTVWEKAGKGEYNNEEVWEAYLQNLKYVLEYVRDLNDVLDGKTVVTSDHGNFVGEGGVYAHPPERKERILREVPWHDISESF